MVMPPNKLDDETSIFRSMGGVDPTPAKIESIGELVRNCGRDPSCVDLGQLYRSLVIAKGRHDVLYIDRNYPRTEERRILSLIEKRAVSLAKALEEADRLSNHRVNDWLAHEPSTDLEMIRAAGATAGLSVTLLRNGLPGFIAAAKSAARQREKRFFDEPPLGWLVGIALPEIGFHYLGVTKSSQTSGDSHLDPTPTGDLFVFVSGALEFLGLNSTPHSIRALIQKGKSKRVQPTREN